jgi:hypothetical protein
MNRLKLEPNLTSGLTIIPLAYVTALFSYMSIAKKYCECEEKTIDKF